jgi:hypothetical protein
MPDINDYSSAIDVVTYVITVVMRDINGYKRVIDVVTPVIVNVAPVKKVRKLVVQPFRREK